MKRFLGRVWNGEPVINPGVQVVEEDEVERPVIEVEGFEVQSVVLPGEVLGGFFVVVLEGVFFCKFKLM